ncbi:MAG: tRNA (N6-threonylcarbamoyladenosine(37)-N6)-methyltransferase TrmO [Neptuniibacter caesariensis]|uniref:tRNA (N6-threonylcarbamoyladenosine(37)-N6)-methyltransferase TrmO n=1 Tax=Neptuniibacter caesariensis TaxID=207954 RepID=A0A2G6JN85_NEPCE|nr:MAG: tRNA (N6-threonylcarbamoyladenosine(37)-N6)-methyltransferase TrmO [Neptuniibacter caesariensis]
MHSLFEITPIATLKGPYKEKFGIPRQPGLVKSLTSTIVFKKGFDQPEMLRGLEQCSHIWLLFIFSECVNQGWSPTVRPPRLGGNKRMGVLATRSPFRPNPIGLSPVRLERIDINGGKAELIVSGADLLDGTPIIDIKPYLPYSDIIPDAEFELASHIELLPHEIVFSAQAEKMVIDAEQKYGLPVKQQISELLKCDPRPAYKKDDSARSYGVRLHDLNIRFRITETTIFVDEINQADA